MQVSQCADRQQARAQTRDCETSQDRVTNLCLANKSRYGGDEKKDLTGSMNKSLTELQKLSHDSVTSSC